MPYKGTCYNANSQAKNVILCSEPNLSTCQKWRRQHVIDIGQAFILMQINTFDARQKGGRITLFSHTEPCKIQKMALILHM